MADMQNLLRCVPTLCFHFQAASLICRPLPCCAQELSASAVYESLKCNLESGLDYLVSVLPHTWRSQCSVPGAVKYTYPLAASPIEYLRSRLVRPGLEAQLRSLRWNWTGL